VPFVFENDKIGNTEVDLVATLIAILFLIVFTLIFQGATTLGFLPIIALVAGTLFFLMTPFVKGLTMLPLQAASVETSSRAYHFARRDIRLVLLTLVWISFALFSFFVAAFSADWLFPIWAIWLGLSIDAIYLHAYAATGYADPYQLVETCFNNGKRSFDAKHHQEFCTAIDSMAEISLKALYQRSLPLTTEGVSKLDQLAELYLKAKREQPPQEEMKEQVSYTLGFLLHRVQMLFEQAAEDRLEVVANQIVLSMSKLTMSVVKFDMELSSLPLHFLENFFQTAKDYELKEVSINSSIILLEMAKSVLHDPDLREGQISTFMFALIEQMERVAKEMFREDKNTPISLLTDPFRELKQLIETKLPPFPDSEAISADLDRVLIAFQALESVLKSVPNIPGYSEAPEEEEESE